ncbi:MAG: hypothetical protein ABI675_15430 [Chitinophagaceae bacterium]
MSPAITYLGATILTLYGLRSFIAGVRNEKRSYWMSIGYDGLKKVLKDNYDKANNLIWGGISFIYGIIIFIAYRP